MSKLEVAHVSKVFGTGPNAVTALDDISLAVEEDEFLTIVGPSGCGKTTLLRIIDGLVQPTDGAISIDGRPINGSGRDRGMVFQNFNLFPWRTVIENVEFGLECMGVEKDERRQLTQTYIEMVGLGEFVDSYPNQLSGGMQQRVGLARALAIDPEILLMDEPFGALDAQTRELMQSELLRIWGEFKKTSVFVTHDIQEAIYLSDRVVVMTSRPGRIRTIIDVPFGRPRDRGTFMDQDAYADLYQDVWNSLEISA